MSYLITWLYFPPIPGESRT